jgi:hypothetical protein
LVLHFSSPSVHLLFLMLLCSFQQQLGYLHHYSFFVVHLGRPLVLILYLKD